MANRKTYSGLIQGLHVFKKLDDMTKGELDSQLKHFIFEVRKENGERYPSSSLRDLFQGIGYHMNQNLNKCVKIFSDQEFTNSRNALDAAMKSATKDGIKPQGNGAASPLSPSDEEKLWSNGVLGMNTPNQLINTVFFSQDCSLDCVEGTNTGN